MREKLTMTQSDRLAAVITGASRGIGAATALVLAERGFRVIVNHRASAPEAEKVVAIQADVTAPGDPEKLIWTGLKFSARTPRYSSSFLRSCFFFFDFKSDVARVSAGMFDQYFPIAALNHGGKLLSPFHQ